MPKVTVETVEGVARLARLSLTDEERRELTRELDAILEWAESLQRLDTAGVPPVGATSAPRLREDEPREGLERDRALAAAPDAAEGLFRVPRILGG